jgi:hypothetical protein
VEELNSESSHNSRLSAALKVPSELHTALFKKFYEDGIFKLVLTVARMGEDRGVHRVGVGGKA